MEANAPLPFHKDNENRRTKMAEHKIELMLNGQRRSFSVETEETLLHVLREKAGLTGTKKGCDLGECGACTVIMNGCAVNSCCVFAVEADGGTVETIEGIGTPEHLHPLQQAFIDAGAIQCGRRCWTGRRIPRARRSTRQCRATCAAAPVIRRSSRQSSRHPRLLMHMRTERRHERDGRA